VPSNHCATATTPNYLTCPAWCVRFVCVLFIVWFFPSSLACGKALSIREGVASVCIQEELLSFCQFDLMKAKEQKVAIACFAQRARGLSASRIDIRMVSLRCCIQLTDGDLEAILKSIGASLCSLDVSGCTALTTKASFANLWRNANVPAFTDSFLSFFLSRRALPSSTSIVHI
jgi:hypothetical protein